MNFLDKIKILLKCKIKFTLPRSNKILIYDAENSDFIIKFFKKEQCAILHTRFEQINILVLFISIFKFQKKKLSTKYVYTYIKLVNPKVIITFIDNRLSFYELKKHFNNIKIICIQNGYKNYASFMDTEKKIEELKKNNFSLDYFFVFNDAYANVFSRFIKGKIIASGSLKNNSILIGKNSIPQERKKLLYISQFRSMKKENENNFSKKIITTIDKMLSSTCFLQSEIKLIPKIIDHCSKNNIFFQICGSSNTEEEFLFYESLIQKEFKSWKFFPKKNLQTTYGLIDEATAVVFIDSSLGYEALSRKKPTASFNIRGEVFDNFEGCKFGKPKKFPEKGPFWCNYLDVAVLENILNFVLNVTVQEWEKIYNEHAIGIAKYDEGNTKFKKIMKNLNLDLVREN